MPKRFDQPLQDIIQTFLEYGPDLLVAVPAANYKRIIRERDRFWIC